MSIAFPLAGRCCSAGKELGHKDACAWLDLLPLPSCSVLEGCTLASFPSGFQFRLQLQSLDSLLIIVPSLAWYYYSFIPRNCVSPIGSAGPASEREACIRDCSTSLGAKQGCPSLYPKYLMPWSRLLDLVLFFVCLCHLLVVFSVISPQLFNARTWQCSVRLIHKLAG